MISLHISLPMPARRTGPWLALSAALLLVAAGPAGAVEHQVFGQVLQVTGANAADDSITNAALPGTPRPFVHVRVLDADTLDLLGEVDSDVNGLFSVAFDRPPSYTPRIVCRVLQVMRDPSTLAREGRVLPPAREGINTFASVPRYFLTFLKVLADDTLAYGAMTGSAGVSASPGVGLLFTRVGNTETQFIRQNTTATGGLADFTSNPSHAAALGVPAFRDAPFGGLLYVFGEFGTPGAGTPCDPPGPVPPPRIDYYQVRIRRLDPAPASSWRLWNQPLQKTRTLVATSPTVSVVSEVVPVGPFSGTESSVGAVQNLYWVNRNEVGGATSTFYSFPDLRVLWSSSAWTFPPDCAANCNGLYEIGLDYFTYVSGAIDNPVVQRLNPSCFATPTAPLGQLYLRVNNQGIELSLEGLFLKTTTGRYFSGVSGGVDTTVPGTAGAHNFATTGLCDIMELKATYDVEARFTARHPGNYMRFYRLQAKPNVGATVTFAAESYPDATTAAPVFPPGASPPLWEGAPAGTTGIVARGDFARCGYIFELLGGSRVQDGDRYLGDSEFEKAWYVIP